MASEQTMHSVEFIYFNAGGGHKSAATALKNIMKEKQPDWDITLVNMEDILHSLDPLRLLKKEKSSIDVYNALLAGDMTYVAKPGLILLQTTISLAAPLIEKLMREHWAKTAPDMVVSIIPNFNRVFFRALKKEHPNTPYVTLMTDIADYPPHFWQEKQDQYIICGSEKAQQQATKIYDKEKIYAASGMILKPQFYAPTKLGDPAVRRLVRQEARLDPDLPTALIMFGGNGSDTAEKIINRFEEAKLEVQSIVMCGSNKALYDRLASRKRCLPVGFTENVPDYMRLADFFIGKPGPGCLSEAVQMGLPVITRKNFSTLPQERYNAKWIEKNDLGLVIKSFKKIVKATEKLLADNRLEQFKENARKMNNRALFEIPEYLGDILAREEKRHPLPKIRATGSSLHPEG